MRRFLAVSIIVFASLSISAENWEEISVSQNALTTTGIPLTSKAKTFTLNTPRFQAGIVDRQQGNQHTIQLPLPNGLMDEYFFQPTKVLSPDLQKKYPNIHTYKVISKANPNNYGHIDISEFGLHAMLLHNQQIVYIEPLDNNTDNTTYQSFYRADHIKEFAATAAYSEHQCHLDHGVALNDVRKQMTDIDFASFTEKFNATNSADYAFKDVSIGSEIRTYRFAIAATGEYTEYHGGTKASALAAIVTAVNRLNQFLERDFSISMQLVANNEDIIYLDAATDPFENASSTSDLALAAPDVINGAIGFDNYDIGHVFSGAGGGGIAYYNAPCSTRENGKARASSTSRRPEGDGFFGLFAHEVGHQLTAPHSFNGGTRSCNDNRSSSGAFEPGSGSTIMSYAGLCGEENIQRRESLFYHGGSIQSVANFLTRQGDDCGVTSGNNAVPMVDAGSDANIPQSTPFTLSGSAIDTDGDALTYIWEQMDLGAQTFSQADLVDDGNRPLFRSFTPQDDATRVFPQLNDILSNTTTYGEVLPTTDRILTMRLTVRDGNGGVESDTRVLTVAKDAGPFSIVYPNNPTWEAGSNQTITWDVANTNLNPINCSAVRIELSSNGGQNFTEVLANSTPNDGSQQIQVPSLTTTEGRVRLSCVTQPFFAINQANIEIITDNGTNNDPEVNPDAYTVLTDTTNNRFPVLANDSDPDGDNLSLSNTSNFSNGGSASISGNNLLYTPANSFSGTETFDYTVSDGNGGSVIGQVTVTVNNLNEAPTAVNDSFNVDRNTSNSLSVLNNDSDPDGDNLSIAAIGVLNNGGTASITGNTINYSPATDFVGTETFSYTVNDGRGESDTAQVNITVNNSNQNPTAQNDSFTVEQDSSNNTFAVLNNDTDGDGDNLTITAVSTFSHGGNATINGSSLRYTPSSGFSGTETFNYSIEDGFGGSSTAIVNVTVNRANEAPNAANDTATVDQDSNNNVINVLANDSDPDGDGFALTAINNVSNGGSATINGSNIDYTPANGFVGIETFNYTINDGNGGIASAEVSVTVEALNQVPVAAPDSFTVQQDTNATSFNVLDNDTDPDNDTLTISTLSDISNGATVNINSASTAINYQPGSGFSGTDTFSYTLSDGNGGTASAIVTITVTATPPPPPPTTDGGNGNDGGDSGGGSLSLLLLALLGLRIRKNTHYV